MNKQSKKASIIVGVAAAVGIIGTTGIIHNTKPKPEPKHQLTLEEQGRHKIEKKE